MQSPQHQSDDGRTCHSDLLDSSLQRELSAAEEVDLQRHVEECNDCRQRLVHSVDDDAWREEASRYLKLDDWDESAESGSSYSDYSCVDHPQAELASESIAIRQLKEWFDPTDDPRYVGRFGGYEILGVVGCGGMGVVLKGFETSLNRYVAIKVLSPTLATSGAARQRFAREAQAAAAVMHENVIAIHRVDHWHELPFLVMPYVSGDSLQKRIHERGPLPLPAILRVGHQIASGLAAAHAQGLVHRDIKPANILLDLGVERVTLTDFGLARAADDASVTKTGVIAGTPQYMSPEQSRGEPIDSRSDLFSLGSVLYEMSTAHRPFKAETDYGIVRRIAEETPQPIREINAELPEWFEWIVQRLHQKSPDDRLQTAGELACLLEECLAHLQQPTKVPLPKTLLRQAESKSLRQRRGLIRRAAWGLGIACGLAATIWAMPHLLKTPDVAGTREEEQSRDELSADVAALKTAEQDAADSANAAAHVEDSTESPIPSWEDDAFEQILQLEDESLRLEEEARRIWGE